MLIRGAVGDSLAQPCTFCSSPGRCIECVPSEQLTTMLDTFNGQIVSLSMHSFGCRVVQRVLEHCGGTPRYDSVMAEVQTVRSAVVLGAC